MRAIAALELDVAAEAEGEARSLALPALGKVRVVAGRPLLRDDEGVVDVEHQDGVRVIGRLGGVELADRYLVEAEHPARPGRLRNGGEEGHGRGEKGGD